MIHHRLNLSSQLSRRETLQIAGAAGVFAVTTSNGAADGWRKTARRTTRRAGN
jgi:hypothetical protein